MLLVGRLAADRPGRGALVEDLAGFLGKALPTSSDLVRSSSSIFEYSIWAMAKGSFPSISGVFSGALVGFWGC